MSINQLSVFVENKEGKLCEITEVLSQANIDIRAMSIADTKEFGILRLIVNKTEEAKKCLEENGFVVSLTPVIGVEINDKPGALAAIMKVLTKHSINMEYMYAFLTKSDDKAYLVIRVEENPSVERILTDSNIPVITAEDVSKM